MRRRFTLPVLPDAIDGSTVAFVGRGYVEYRLNRAGQPTYLYVVKDRPRRVWDDE